MTGKIRPHANGSNVASEALGAHLVGAVLADKYALEAMLGSGSTGVVYRALHVELEREVAIKILNPEMMESAIAVERFKREARAASRLDHPNAMRALDFGEDSRGLLFIVFELIEGPDLYDVVEREGALAPARAVRLMSQVLDAAGRAHELGVIHRDLKPENIMLQQKSGSDGRVEEVVKVCDFGIAKLSPLGLAGSARGRPEVTTTGLLIGTPHYMSPEQARAEPLDHRTDIYSAGVMLFQLLTGRLPFENDSPLAVAVMQCSSPPPRPSSLARVSPGLDAVCLKALSKQREDRYQSADEMRRALLAAAAVGADDKSGAFPHEESGPRLIAGAPPAASGLAAEPARVPSAALRQGAALVPAPSSLIVSSRRSWLSGGLGLALITSAVCAFVLAQKARGPHASAAKVAAASTAKPARAVEHASSAAALPVADVALSEPSGLSLRAEAVAEAPAIAAAEIADTVANPAAAPLRSKRGAGLLGAPAPTNERRLRFVPAPSEAEPEAVLAVSPTDENDHVGGEPAEPAKHEAGDAPSAPSEPGAGTTASPATAEAAIAEHAAEAATSVRSAVIASAPPAAPAPARAANSAQTAEVAQAPEALAVSVAVLSTTAGVSRASVRNAFSPRAFTLCYRDAARAHDLPDSLTHAQLDIVTDEAGRVTATTARGDGVPDPLRRCLEIVARSARVREVDTGRASATLDLTLSRHAASGRPAPGVAAR